jgi:glycosyltransferase involved in cell wall biosynthesis
MKILLVHNHYGSAAPSGENEVFLLERDMLRRGGCEVDTYERHSDEIRRRGLIGMVIGALATPWNATAARSVCAAVDRCGADLVHVHNTFPLISPAIFAAVGDRATRVLTLHNYRVYCPAAIPIRDGRTCTECLDKRSAGPSVQHGCYRRSRLATLPLAASVELHRRIRTWEREVDAFIVLTEFQRELMVRAGLPGPRVWVKPNCFPGTPEPTPWVRRRAAVVFAGRLSEEKGVADLIDAWLAWGDSAPELRILGDGPLRAELGRRAAARPGVRITFLGRQPSDVAQAEIAAARLVVVPSVCFEGFPMVIREAFAFGTPAAVSGIGPLPHIVENGKTGVVFRSREPVSIHESISAAWHDAGRLEDMGRHARREFDAKYTERINLSRLLDIYQSAHAVRRERMKH